MEAWYRIYCGTAGWCFLRHMPDICCSKISLTATEDAATKRRVLYGTCSAQHPAQYLKRRLSALLYSYLPSRVWHRFGSGGRHRKISRIRHYRICRYVSGRSDRICNQSGKRSGSSSCMQCFRFREKVPLISDTDSLFRSSDRSSAHWLPYWYMDLFFLKL